MHGYINKSGQMIDTGESVMVKCDEGYVDNITRSASIFSPCTENHSLLHLDSFKCSCELNLYFCT